VELEVPAALVFPASPGFRVSASFAQSPTRPFPRDFTTNQCSRASADDCADGAISARVDRTSNKRPAYPADNEANRPIASATMESTVFTAPFAHLVLRVSWSERNEK
jgi:hypothetical protein